jgi:hypothetical protein
MRWLQLVWMAPLAMGLGCGGNVDVNTGGGGSSTTANGGSSGKSGSGGSGGSAGSSGKGGSAGASGSSGKGGSGGGLGGSGGSGGSKATSSGGMGGTGGGSVCDDACALAVMCGLPDGLCEQYLDCGTPQGECFALCVAQPGVDCAELFDALQGNPGPLTDCVQACQGGGTGGTGGTGMGGAGGSGPSQQCQQCGQDQCAGAAQECFMDNGIQPCQGWINCVGGCSDPACFNGCTAMFPAGKGMADCACGSCAMECSGICSGSGTGGTGGTGMGGSGGSGDPGNQMACQECGQQQCASEVQQCFGAGFQVCQAWLSCTQSCMNKKCIDDCSAMIPAGAALGECICSECFDGGCGYTCD